MGMHITRDFFGRQFGIMGQGKLRQQFGDIWTHHMRAKDFPVFRVSNYLDKALTFAKTKCFTVGNKRELADIHFVTRFFGLLFRVAKAGNLRYGVGAAGHHPEV